MNFELTEQHKLEISKWAEEAFPNECCGIIKSIDDKISVVNYVNKSEDPKHSFRLHPSLSNTEKIIAYYHSHPTGENKFSEEDIIVAEKLKLKSILFTKPFNFSYYTPIGKEFSLVGRKFVHGIMDCLTLIQDYFRTKFNIEMEDGLFAYRIDDLKDHCDKNLNKFYLLNYFLENGFIETKELKKNCIILMRNKYIKSACHCAVYYGTNKILHHIIRSKSKIEEYNKFHREKMMHILKHPLV